MAAKVEDIEADRRREEEERELVMALQQPFKTLSELNVVWLRGKEGENKEAYDGFASFCLEITYRHFLKDRENAENRFVNFQPNIIVDVDEMIETTEKFEETGNIVERQLPAKSSQPSSVILKVFEPLTSYKEDPNIRTNRKSRKSDIKEYSPIKRLSDENYAWLANEWAKENG